MSEYKKETALRVERRFAFVQLSRDQSVISMVCEIERPQALPEIELDSEFALPLSVNDRLIWQVPSPRFDA